MKGKPLMKKKIAAILLLFSATLLFAFDPLSVDIDDRPANDDENLAYFLIYCDGGPWEGPLNSFAKRLGNEKVGKRIVEFMEPVFDKACVSTYADREYQLCQRGLMALGSLMATNSLPFLEKAVLNGREDLCDTALGACQQIMGYGDAYLDLLDRALREGAIARKTCVREMGWYYRAAHRGTIPVTPQLHLKASIGTVSNPTANCSSALTNDVFLLADFPSYTNSVERLAALSAFLDNENTPPEVRAKYEPERDRLKALPPESLVRVTDELEAQLDALLKAAERKRKIEQVKKYAVPAGIAVLVLAALVFIIRKRFR